MEIKIIKINLFINFFKKYSIYLILIFALILRYRGINYGLPYIYRDEETFVNPSIQMLITGDLNPHWFGHPGSFIMYLLLILFFIYFIFFYLFGYVHNFGDFEYLFSNDPSLFYLGGRLLIIIMALITIYLVYLIANNLFNRAVSILASFLLAISPLHNDYSRIIRTDVAATMLVMFSIYFLLRFIDSQNKNTKLLILSSLFAGFSIAAKYTAGIIIFPILIHCLFVDLGKKCSLRYEKTTKYSLLGFGILLVVISIFIDLSWLNSIGHSYLPTEYCERCNDLINNSYLLFTITGILLIIIAYYYNNLFYRINILIIATISIFTGFFVFAPFVIFDPITAINDIIIENRGIHLGQESLPGMQNYFWYLTNSLRGGIGGLFFEMFAGLGLLFILYNKNYKKNLFLIFPIVYFLIVGNMKLRWYHWFIPILPFEAIFFGLGYYCCYKYITQVKISRILKPKKDILPITKIICSVFVVIILLGSILPIISDINKGTKLGRLDTRSIAKNWIENNLQDDSIIEYDVNGPQLNKWPHNNFTLIKWGWYRGGLKQLSYYKNTSINYIIITEPEIYTNRYFKEPDKYANEISNYNDLINGAELIKVFDNKNNPGPNIEIYRFKLY
ncbi:MAG: glycosyltransferase family 39 protein [Candidatus Methanoperedens sp.]|nr:glycosyltransferase family 39 protein [Candidatus Methanoperedens sp.]